jgi:hypothetical protein
VGSGVLQFDAWCEQEDLEKQREEIRAMNRRQAALASHAQSIAYQRLVGVTLADGTQLPGLSPTDLTPLATLKFIKDAAQVERLARGQPTAVIKGVGDVPDLDMSQFTEEELELFETLLSKAQRMDGAAAS